MADTKKTAAPPAAETKETTGRPQLPDEAVYQKNLKAAEADHKLSMDKLAQIKSKIDLALPNKDKEKQSPAQKRRQELIAQANEIRQKQGAGKNARGAKLDQIKRLDEQMRSRINEQKVARGKVAFKTVDELDRQIAHLDAQVNAGTMKIVDEKKALAEISSLKKTRKNFSQFEDGQKQIDDLKAKIKEIKDSMDDPEARAMSDQYTKIQAELDALKAESDEAYKGLSSLRDERTRLQAEQQDKFQGTKILSKKDREEDFFPATKKGKKGKKGGGGAAAASPAEGAKFSCPPSVVEDCAAMGIDPPMSAADIPSVTEQVKAKLDHWKADQAAQTQKNIEKAKAKIAALEAEEETDKTNGANGAADTSSAVEEVTKDLKETSVEDKA
ncbi:Heat shock protein 60 [Verticillium dahliae VDG2]|nr:Heat shock protein 60 [Verticillium dahliae VDG2]